MEPGWTGDGVCIFNELISHQNVNAFMYYRHGSLCRKKKQNKCDTRYVPGCLADSMDKWCSLLVGAATDMVIFQVTVFKTGITFEFMGIVMMAVQSKRLAEASQLVKVAQNALWAPIISWKDGNCAIAEAVPPNRARNKLGSSHGNGSINFTERDSEACTKMGSTRPRTLPAEKMVSTPRDANC